MKVKVCGIQTIEDAKFAEANDADFIGFVFAPSKRRITPIQAATISSSLTGRAKKVGVFVNETIETMVHIAKTVQLDYIQLHGDEPAQVAKALPFPIIKAISIGKAETEDVLHYPCDYLLIDSPSAAHEGGSGITFDWKKLNKVEFDRSKFILAGGLTPENVHRAIEKAGPVGVDVSSGIETDGNKDKIKIKQFIQNAKANKGVEAE